METTTKSNKHVSVWANFKMGYAYGQALAEQGDKDTYPEDLHDLTGSRKAGEAYGFRNSLDGLNNPEAAWKDWEGTEPPISAKATKAGRALTKADAFFNPATAATFTTAFGRGVQDAKAGEVKEMPQDGAARTLGYLAGVANALSGGPAVKAAWEAIKKGL